MGIYLLIFFVVLISVKLNNTKKIGAFDIFILLLLIFVAGLRNVGTDYMMYKYIYFNPTVSSADKVELGFKLLINIVYYFFNEKYYIFFLICSAISIIPIFMTFKKNCTYFGFALLVFISLGFYTLSFNIVRQFIALSIFIYALKYIRDKKLIKYIISIMVAILFHTTSLVVLIAYFFGNAKINKKNLIFIFLILLMSGFLFNPIFNFVVNNISIYKMYANYSGVDAGIGTYLVNFIYIIIILFNILNYDKITKNNFDKICVKISTISVAFIILSLQNILFARLIYYFFIPAIIPFSNIFDFFKDCKTKKIFKIIIVIILLIVYILNIVSFNGVYPYDFTKI